MIVQKYNLLVRGGWPLIGRDEEMAVVSDVIAAPVTGGVVVAGRAGVGKTRLVREAFARAIRQGRRCHWIIATASARSVPLGAFAEFTTGFGPDPLLRVHEVINALAGAETPMATVVGIDDAHLLDEQSALVVHELVQRRAATIVLTHRSGELAPDAIASLWKDERIPRLDLRPLAADELAALLTQVLGSAIESSSVERLWRYTRGNLLYLRQLIIDETDSGRLIERAGVWVWDDRPKISPTLNELIEANIGRRSEDVIAVLDIVALAEPVELPLLLRVAAPTAVDEAHEQGLIRIDSATQVARLAHPMFGEARRLTAGPVRLGALRRRLAQAIGDVCAPSLHQTVRRAVLMLESDGVRDPRLLQDAGAAALQLMDIKLAVRLAHAATECGGGRPAQLQYAVALAIATRGRQAEELLSHLAITATEDAERARVALARAANLAWSMGKPIAAERALDSAQEAAQACGLANSFNAVRASCRAARARPSAAVELAADALSAPEVTGFARMLGLWGQVFGSADVGHVDQLSVAATDGYALARQAFDASHLRFGMALAHIDGLSLAGEVQKARDVATQLRRAAQDFGVSRQSTALMVGRGELAAGNLAVAQKWLRESVALALDFQYEFKAIPALSAAWLATALAMAGDVEGAQQALAQRPDGDSGGFRYWEADQALAEAWTAAVGGLPSLAVTTALEAANRARSLNRPARELLCLQTATQFGDSSSVHRLAELSSTIQGPRVGAVAAHCAALHAHEGNGLLVASRSYEAFGDRVAAIDSAAQAAVIFRRQGRRGASLNASALAQQLAREVGADTYQLRASRAELPFTGRQLEIITLAARGLSNREIAEKLMISVRTVEGHLFQASQAAGVNTREELVDLLPRALTDGRGDALK